MRNKITCMAGSRWADIPPKDAKVVRITKAKRLGYSKRPAAEPPCRMQVLETRGIPESSRIAVTRDYLGVDIDSGDLDQSVLRKARYVVERLGDKIPDPEGRGNNFHDSSVKMKGMLYILDILAEYGEPEGLGVLRIAHELFGSNMHLHRQIHSVAEAIGTRRSLNVLLSAFVSDPSKANHLQALKDFAWWYPGAVESMIRFIRASALSQKTAKKAIAELQDVHDPEITVTVFSE